MRHFYTGFKYVLDGFDLITRPGLRRFVCLPVLLNLIIFTGLFYLAKHYVQGFDQWLQHLLPIWLSWLTYLLWVVFFISYLLFFLILFATLANLIGAPFYGFLSEKTILLLGGKLPQSQGMWAILREGPRAIWRQLALLGYVVTRALLILVIMFIPLVHTITPLLWLLLSVWYLSLSMLDYPSDLSGASLKKVRYLMRQDYALTFGYGLTVLFLLSVPVINLFVPAAAVAGACKWWIERGELGEA